MPFPSAPVYRRLGALICLVVMIGTSTVYAQETYQDIHISFTNNLLTISATDADLKAVFTRLAEKTGIQISFQSTIQKTITIDQEGLKLKDAIEILSKDLNTFIVYKGPSRKKAAISKVFIVNKSTLSPQARNKQNRTLTRIKNYERQIESLRKRLSRTEVNSPQAKRYEARINRIEKSIQRLQKQLY